MWVVNNQKERTKVIIKNDIKSNLTNLIYISNLISESVALVKDTIGGAPSGVDKEIESDCQAVQSTLSLVRTKLYEVQNLTDMLDTKEWVDE